MKQNLAAATLPLGIALTAAACAAYRIPAVPDALDAYVTPSHVDTPLGQVTLTLSGLPIALSDTTQGGGIKLLDFPLGLFKVHGGFASLQVTTTSVLANSLNASKAILWALGTAAQTTLTLAGPDGAIMPAVAAVSSATIDVANAATIGRVLTPSLLNGASTAADLYLNIAVPTATDIDATDPTTVTVSGTITLFIQDLGAATTLASASRMPTAGLWATCPEDAIARQQVDGLVYFNDFTEGGYTLANNQTVTHLARGVYGATAATAGSTISQLATAPYGVVSLNTTTDNEDAMIMILGGANNAGQIVLEAGKRFWLSCRIKTVNITDAKYGIFVGLAEEGLCATTAVIADTGALADKDYIGFHRLEADGDKFDIVYNTASGGGQVVHLADGITIVADTYMYLDMYCDGTSIYFYANGVQVGTALALATAKVPDGEEMAFYAVQMAAHADDASTQIDQVKIAVQLS